MTKHHIRYTLVPTAELEPGMRIITEHPHYLPHIVLRKPCTHGNTSYVLVESGPADNRHERMITVGTCHNWQVFRTTLRADELRVGDVVKGAGLIAYRVSTIVRPGPRNQWSDVHITLTGLPAGTPYTFAAAPDSTWTLVP
jgi:hypothetical protein